MSRQTVNDTFSLEIPDSFELLSGEDLGQLSNSGKDPYQWGVRCREKHLLLVAAWKKYPALLAWMADLKAIAKRNAQLTGRVYEKNEYRFLKFDSLQAGEARAEGYQFSYSVEGVRQAVTNYLIKDGKTVYVFMWAGREENTAADHELFAGIMKSLRRV